MNKILIASTIALLTTYTAGASASNGVYVAGEVGTSIINTKDVNVTDTVSQTGFTEPFSFDFKNKHKAFSVAVLLLVTTSMTNFRHQ